MEVVSRFHDDPGAFVFGILRIMIGLMLLWAFFDKLFGLGYPTPSGMGYLDGGSPTEGFLMMASNGTFGWLFKPMVDIHQVLDVLIIVSMLGLSIGLILGIGKKICCVGGMVMFLIFYLALCPIDDNPILDYHLIYIVILFGVLVTNSCKVLGLGKMWSDTELVKRFSILE